MLRFLIDTDAAIELLRGRDPEVVAAFADRAGECALCSVSVFELWYGAERSSDPVRNRRAVSEFMSLFALLDFDIEAASHAAEIRAVLERQGTPIGPYDTQIAAVARSRGLAVVTRNRREFQRVPGMHLADWWP